MNKISAVILVNNPRPVFAKTLESLQSLDEIILINNGEEEALTPYVKSLANISIYNENFLGFGKLRQLGETKARNDWILAIDSDEVLSEDAVKTIFSLTLDKSNVYSFPFKNYLFGKWIKACDWHPDRHVRLYNKQATGFNDAKVHENLKISEVKAIKLHSPFIHYSYGDVSDFLKKMEIYSSLFTAKKNKPSKFFLMRAICGSLFTFLKSYFFQKGIFYGFRGLLISKYKADVVFFKYSKAWEKFNKQL